MSEVLDTNNGQSGDITFAASGRNFDNLPVLARIPIRLSSSSTVTPSELAIRGMVNLACLEHLRAEILGFADSIRSLGDGAPQLRDCLRLGLSETLQVFQGQLQQGKGILQVMLDKRLHQRYSDYDVLVRDYGVDSVDDQVDFSGCQVPLEGVTGVQLLPYPSLPNDYHPVANLRIRSSSDVAMQIRDPRGEICDELSLGRWFHFPLDLTKMALLEPLA